MRRKKIKCVFNPKDNSINETKVIEKFVGNRIKLIVPKFIVHFVDKNTNSIYQQSICVKITSLFVFH